MNLELFGVMCALGRGVAICTIDHKVLEAMPERLLLSEIYIYIVQKV